MQYSQKNRDDDVMAVLIAFLLSVLFGAGSAAAFLAFNSNGWGALLALMAGAFFLTSVLACCQF